MFANRVPEATHDFHALSCSCTRTLEILMKGFARQSMADELAIFEKLLIDESKHSFSDERKLRSIYRA